MRSKLYFNPMFISVCLLSLTLSGCLLGQAGTVSTAPPVSLPTESLPTEIPSTSVPTLPVGTLTVVFVKDGDIQVWDEATLQTRTMVNTGDVSDVTVSDDGQMIAFTRRSWIGDVTDGYEQFALWVMNHEGENPRELISAQDLRQRMSPSERESSNVYQLNWVPQSHQLIFSGTKYIVQAEGLSHAIPHGVYLVDTDQGSVTVLAEAPENLRFLPSPDGKQIALMSPSSMDFINADGSNRREDVLTYAEVGLTNPLFPTGVWTQDSRAFVMTGSFGRDPKDNIDFMIWFIPADGSSPEALAAITGSDPSSVTFSPDGKSVSFLQTTDQQPQEIAGWSIRSLLPEAGPLALPYYGKETFSASLHWSPDGDAFTIKDRDIVQLCPDATQDSQVCGEAIHLVSRIIISLQWVDSSRLLFVGNDPNTLSLGKLDGTITPIVTWTENETLSGWSFSISH